MKNAPLGCGCLFATLACLSHGQPSSPRVSIGAPEQYSYDGVKRLMKELPGKLDIQRLRAIVPGSPEERVMDGGRKSIEGVLNLRFDTFPAPRAFTLVEDDGDSLVARWDLTSTGRVEQSVWLLDTPLTTTAVIVVPSAVLTRDSIERYVEGLMRWDPDSPVALRRITLRYLPQEGSQQIAVGHMARAPLVSPAVPLVDGRPIAVDRTPTEQTLISVSSYFLTAMSAGPRGYVRISAFKQAVFHNYAAEDCEVRERFPPLSERIKSLGRTGLLQDLGKGQFRQRPHIYPDNRDEILLSEITEREPLTGDEMRSYLAADPGRFSPVEELPTYRLRVLLRVLARRGQLLQSKDSLASIALTTALPSRYLEIFYGSLCSYMAEQKIEFSEASFAMVKAKKAVGASLHCLSKTAKDQVDLQRLAEVEVPPEFEDRKRSMLDSARFRIEDQRRERERLERLSNPPPQPKRPTPLRPPARPVSKQ